MTADDILKRLFAIEDKTFEPGGWDESAYIVLIDDARAYLAAREKVVWAETLVRFVPPANGHPWRVMLGAWSKDEAAVRVRLPVPAHLLNPAPIEGEVVEGE